MFVLVSMVYFKISLYKHIHEKERVYFCKLRTRAGEVGYDVLHHNLHSIRCSMNGLPVQSSFLGDGRGFYLPDGSKVLEVEDWKEQS